MRLLMDIDHVFAKSVIEFVLIDRIYRSRMDILVFEFERYDIIRKIKTRKNWRMIERKLIRSMLVKFFSRDLFFVSNRRNFAITVKNW